MEIYDGFHRSHRITHHHNHRKLWSFQYVKRHATTQVLIEGAGDDEDKDGIQNVYDRCPSGIGESDGWRSTPTTDGDQDGCRDDDEDDDDDNDGIIDQHDLCAESYGWVSTPSADYDYDGCHDTNEDEDDDNDGVNDVDDSCPVGRKGWYSTDTAIGITMDVQTLTKTTTTTMTTMQTKMTHARKVQELDFKQHNGLG